MGRTPSAVKNRYNAKAYDRLGITVKKGQKAEIQAHATAQGKSLNGYIVDLIETDMRTVKANDFSISSNKSEPEE